MGLPPQVSGALPLVGHAVRFFRQPVELVEQGRREHGSMFTFKFPRRSMVILLGSQRHKFFFSETDKSLSYRAAYPYLQRMFSPEFYFLGDSEEYNRQQDIIVPRFRGSQLEGHVSVMEHETIEFTGRLGDSGEFDLTDELGPLVMRIAARAFLGPDLASRMNRDFFDEFRRFSEGMALFLPSWAPRVVRSRNARNWLRAALGKMIEERHERPHDPPDFLQLLTEATYADGEPVPDLILVNMVMLFTWAGHETTNGQLAWALVDLLRHPEHHDRVRVEAEAVLADGPLDLAKLRSMDHLMNCLHETERLHPVAFMISRIAVEDIELDGYDIPKGTLVSIVPAVSHRLAEDHARPEEFWPERFARGRKGKLEQQSLAGFGGGLHRCIGMHFAQLEMKVVIAHLLANYDLELLDPDPQPVSGSKTKWPASPCRIRYRRKV